MIESALRVGNRRQATVQNSKSEKHGTRDGSKRRRDRLKP
jgi:hypothetical protein